MLLLCQTLFVFMEVFDVRFTSHVELYFNCVRIKCKVENMLRCFVRLSDSILGKATDEKSFHLARGAGEIFLKAICREISICGFEDRL